MKENRILVLSCPTASGKTAAAVALARLFPLELVNADSLPVHRGMDGGGGRARRLAASGRGEGFRSCRAEPGCTSGRSCGVSTRSRPIPPFGPVFPAGGRRRGGRSFTGSSHGSTPAGRGGSTRRTGSGWGGPPGVGAGRGGRE